MGNHAPILLCVLAVAGLLVAEHRDSRVGLWLTKPLASAAFIWLGLVSGGLDSAYGNLVLLALVWCLLGDILLIPRDRPKVFRAGVFAFLLGHVAYSAAFLSRPLAPEGLLVAAIVLGVAILAVLRWLDKSLPADMVGGANLHAGHRRHVGARVRGLGCRRSLGGGGRGARLHGFRHFSS